MKDLNRYIKESLLDDEDDLVDDQSLFAMEWLSQNVAFGFSHDPIGDEANKYFENDHGVINMVDPWGLTFTFMSTPNTDFIKKINPDKNNINIDYPIKSQDDIDMFTGISYISNQKLLKNITIPITKINKVTFDTISKINNIKIDCKNASSQLTIEFFGRCPIKKWEDLNELNLINNKSIKTTIVLSGSFFTNLSRQLNNLDPSENPSSYITKRFGNELTRICKKLNVEKIWLGYGSGKPGIKYSEKYNTLQVFNLR